MADEKVLYEIKDRIAWITLNRPESLNAVNRDMVKSIVEYCRQAEEDRNVQIVIFKGNGERAFSVGGDIKDRARQNATAVEQSESPLVQRQSKYSAIPGTPAPAIAAVNKITIALVHGYCVGTGLLMSLACDIRIASNLATFGPSFALIGLHPDWGGSWFLPRLLGTARACELTFTGAMISAEEAERIGLVNRVVQHEQLIRVVTDLAEKMAKNPAGVLRLAKESIYRSVTSDLETAFARENDVQIECFYSDEFLERITAFLERRQSRSKG